VVNAGANGIQVRGTGTIDIAGNTVRGAPTGIHVLDADVTVSDNTIAGATLHAVSLIGAVKGSTVSFNTLGGSGSSAVDLSRSSDDVESAVQKNDTKAWQRVITTDGLISTITHPLTLIWLAITGMVVTSGVLRRKQRRKLTPYLELPARSAATEMISSDQQRAIQALIAIESGPSFVDTPRRSPTLPFDETLPSGIALRVRTGVNGAER
jgi:hypothetical protein